MVEKLESTSRGWWADIAADVTATLENGEDSYRIEIVKIGILKWEAKFYDDPEKVREIYGE